MVRSGSRGHFSGLRGGRGREPAAVVADSAGIAIALNPRAAIEAAPVWDLTEGPIVVLGSAESVVADLYRVVSVAPQAGGPVAIGMTAPPRLLLVESDGSAAIEGQRPRRGPRRVRWNLVDFLAQR